MSGTMQGGRAVLIGMHRARVKTLIPDAAAAAQPPVRSRCVAMLHLVTLVLLLAALFAVPRFALADDISQDSVDELSVFAEFEDCDSDEGEDPVASGSDNETLALAAQDAPQPAHGVPVLSITSDDPEHYGLSYIDGSRDHSATATGSYVLLDADGNVVAQGALSEIRGRGNSTWHARKKPYQIKLDKGASLIDGTSANKAKTWVLLANAYDETSLRNYIALKTAVAMGIEGTPDCMFVELYYDGEYRGLYLLCEKVQVKKGRIEIDQEDNASPDGTDLEEHPTAIGVNKYGLRYQYVEDSTPVLPVAENGYLMEIDKYYYGDERCWFFTSIGPVAVKSPENLSQEQMVFLSEQVQEAINAASQRDGDAAAFIDLESLARTFIVNEFGKNSDWMRFSSTFFYYDGADGLLHFGPVWDFDLAFGTRSYANDGEFIDVSGYASQRSLFFWRNEQFRAVLPTVFENEALPVLKQWTEGSPDAVVPTVDELSAQLNPARQANETKWWYMYVGAVAVRTGDYELATVYLRDWIADRTDWLEAHIDDPNPVLSDAGVVRLAGPNALGTMSAILDEAAFEKGGTVVLVTSSGFHDALTACGLAGMADAPVIMTNGKQLSPETAAQLETLEPQLIVVCGGPAAVSEDVAQAASAAAGGARVERCAGATAVGTAIDVAQRAPELTGGAWGRTAFVCTSKSYHDALSVASVSYACGMPIFLLNRDGTASEETIEAIKASSSAVYVVGGPAAVPKETVDQLQAHGIVIAGRIEGDTAIETSSAVARFGLRKGMSADRMGVATSQGYWDALSGAPLCGRNHSVLVLARSASSSSITDFISGNWHSIGSVYVFGGDRVVGDDVLDAIARETKIPVAVGS